MVEQGTEAATEPKYAHKIDPKQLNLEKLAAIRKQQVAGFQKNYGKMRNRNIITGLMIGGITMAIYGYTIFSVTQEKFLDELEDEAKVARTRYAKTSAN